MIDSIQFEELYTHLSQVQPTYTFWSGRKWQWQSNSSYFSLNEIFTGVHSLMLTVQIDLNQLYHKTSKTQQTDASIFSTYPHLKQACKTLEKIQTVYEVLLKKHQESLITEVQQSWYIRLALKIIRFVFKRSFNQEVIAQQNLQLLPPLFAKRERVFSRFFEQAKLIYTGYQAKLVDLQRTPQELINEMNNLLNTINAVTYGMDMQGNGCTISRYTAIQKQQMQQRIEELKQIQQNRHYGSIDHTHQIQTTQEHVSNWEATIQDLQQEMTRIKATVHSVPQNLVSH